MFNELYNLLYVAGWSTWRIVSGYTSMIKEVPESVKLDGKVSIVTGSNTGIGYWTVIDLAKRGSKVFVGNITMRNINLFCSLSR